MASSTKLTRGHAVAHRRACELVDLDRDLSEDEKWFVLEHFHESQTTLHSLDGAFFTPLGLARDLAIEVSGDRIIDLCAGIGRLAWACRDPLRRLNNEPARELVCVERNPDYVRVGRKILPHATWIRADVFDVAAMGLDRFDCAIANPPFGRISRTGNAPGYRGGRFEYHVIALAAQLARRGVFIVPQASAPFRYSGQPNFRVEPDGEYRAFTQATGIELEHSCGIDTSSYAGDWRGVCPATEIVLCDFTEPAGQTALPWPT